MKTTIITSCLLLVSLIELRSQNLLTAAQVEYTVAGVQFGGLMMFETKKQFGSGFFYQTNRLNSSKELSTKNYYGIQLQVPLVKSSRLLFAATMRAGFVQDKFFVVVPGLETRVSIRKRFAMGWGMSLRMNYPSISTKLIIKLF